MPYPKSKSLSYQWSMWGWLDVAQTVNELTWTPYRFYNNSYAFGPQSINYQLILGFLQRNKFSYCFSLQIGVLENLLNMP